MYTAADLGDYWKPGPLLVSPPPIDDITFNERTQVPLAKDKVRFAGEPIVMVLAESRYMAEDALADVQVDYEPLRSRRGPGEGAAAAESARARGGRIQRWRACRANERAIMTAPAGKRRS